jgi:hypothetical protein
VGRTAAQGEKSCMTHDGMNRGLRLVTESVTQRGKCHLVRNGNPRP